MQQQRSAAPALHTAYVLFNALYTQLPLINSTLKFEKIGTSSSPMASQIHTWSTIESGM